MAEPEKKKFSAKVSGLFGELRKVTWPTFSKVVAQTGVVLAVTIFFLVILMIMDFGLGQLYDLLVSELALKPLRTVLSSVSSVVSSVPKL